MIINVRGRRRSATGGPPVTSGLMLHLDASQITGLAYGDTVPTWNDLSGRGNHVDQYSGTPSYEAASLGPAVYFDGVDETMGVQDFPDMAIATPTIFALVERDGDGNASQNLNTIASYRHYGTGGAWLVGAEKSVFQWQMTGYNGSGFLDNIQGNSGYTANPELLVWLWGDGVQVFRKNTVGEDSANNGALGGYPSTARFMLGDVWGGAAPKGWRWEGYIYELLIYDSALASGDMQSVEAYINDKWSVY